MSTNQEIDLSKVSEIKDIISADCIDQINLFNNISTNLYFINNMDFGYKPICW